MYKWCSQGFGMRPCYEIWNPLDYSEAATLANRSKLNLVPISWEKIGMKFTRFGPLIQLEWHQIKILLVNIISASSTFWVPLLHWYCSCDPEWLVWYCCCAEQKSKNKKKYPPCLLDLYWHIMAYNVSDKYPLWMREIYIHIEYCINNVFFVCCVSLTISASYSEFEFEWLDKQVKIVGTWLLGQEVKFFG